MTKFKLRFSSSVLVIRFSLIYLLIIGNGQAFAADAANAQELTEASGQSVETSMQDVKKPEASTISDAGLLNEADASVVDSEVQVQQPLDLTFKPDFPENPVPYGQEGNAGTHQMSDLFGKNKANSSLKFSGELLKAEKEEQGKVRPVDGAGIRIELNPK